VDGRQRGIAKKHENQADSVKQKRAALPFFIHQFADIGSRNRD